MTTVAKGFDLGAVLSDVSKMDTEYGQLQKIDIDLLNADKKNFYSLDGVDELAENIEFIGLQQPLLVRPDPDAPGKFRVISGHRRRDALRMIVDAGNEAFRFVPCIVEAPAGSDELQELKLIYANSDTRRMSSADVAKQAERVEALLYALQGQGVEFPGRMRDHIAEVCKVSASKLARLKVIREALIPEIKEIWGKGNLPESSAYRIAQESKELQQMLLRFLGVSQIKGSSEWWIDGKLRTIQKISQRKCKPCKDVCENAETMLDWIFANPNAYHPCEYHCCADCDRLGSCKKSCPAMAKKAADKKALDKERKQKAKEYQEAADLSKIKLIRTIWQRWDSARRAAGKTVRECFDVYGKYFGAYFEKDVPGYIDGSGEIKASTVLPFEYMYHDAARSLIQAADLLDCSVDYLLGRTDSMTTTQAAETKPVWHDGLPDQTGDMIAVLEIGGLRLKKLCYYDHVAKDFYFSRGGQKIDGAKCLSWYAVPSDE